MELYKKYQQSDCNLYVFSTLESAETFIDAIDKKSGAKARIHLINNAQIIAYDLMAKHPMYEAAEKCNSNTMSVLVIGAGTIGMECIKAAMWCGRMNTFGFKIRIIDAVDRKTEFLSRYGDFDAELAKTGLSVDYRFFVADTNSVAFSAALEQCSDANYIIVATGDDELTINVARRVSKHYVRRAVRNGTYNEKVGPTIIPIISNVDYYEALQFVKENDKISSAFYPSGCYCDIYKVNTITNWPIERIAEYVHNELYNQYKDYSSLLQTEKRSNRANAVHVFYKIRDAGIILCRSSNDDLRKKCEENKMVILQREHLKAYLKNEFINGKKRLETLVELEHDRWCVFQILDGWISWNDREIKDCINPGKVKYPRKHKLVSGLFHGCLIPNSALKGAGEALYNEKDHFIAHDQDVTSLIYKDLLKTIEEHMQIENKNEKILMYIPRGSFNADLYAKTN